MHRYFLILIFILTGVFQLQAQEKEEYTEDSSSVKIFIAAGIDYGIVYNKNEAYQINISGGFEYHNIYIGGFGSSIINTIDVVNDTMYNNMQIDLGYGGFMLGYEFLIAKNISAFPCVQAGWGVLSLSKKNDRKNYMERIYFDNVFLINPTFQIGYKLTNSFSINACVTYQTMIGLTSLSGFSDKNFSGINYGLALKYHM